MDDGLNDAAEAGKLSPAVLWIGLIPAMVVPFAASLFYFVVFSEHSAGPLIYKAAKVFTVVWPVVCVVVLWRGGFRWLWADWGKLRHHLRAVPLGLATGLLIIAAMTGLLQTPLGEIVRASGPAMRHKAASLGFLEHYLLFATFLSVMHSLIEEYYWRWFVYGNLRRLVSLKAAATIASVAFASHHFVITAQFFPIAFAFFLSICVAVGGLLWCWLYQKQGSLAGAWISHLIADVGLMSVGYVLLH